VTGTPWNLAAAKDADGNDVQIAGNANLTVDADGHLTGNDGCNSISGDVQIGDRTIEFPGGLAVTEMACTDDAVMATEQFVLAVLGGTVQWSVDGDQLTLTRDGAGTLIFTAGTPPTSTSDPADLIGKTWTLTTIETGTGPDGVASSVSQPAKLQVFADRVELYGGCARYDATVADGTMDIGSTDTSTVDCAWSMDDLDRIHDILVSRVTWRITDDQLTITKDGVGALIFARAAGNPVCTSTTCASHQLVGTTWNFDYIQTENANSGSGSSTSGPIALLFDDADSYRLVTGCHAYQGDYAVDGSTITFSNQRDLGGDDCLDTVAQQLVEFLDGPMDWTFASRLVQGSNSLVMTKGSAKAVFSDPP
jgi:heat shock protein HslJ